MNNFRDYIVEFKKLGKGFHILDFKINKSFFDHFDYTEFENPKIKVRAELEVDDNLISVVLKIIGTINVQCDVCLDKFDLKIKKKTNLFFKISDEVIEEDDDIIYISSDSDDFDLSKHIFDYIILSLPIKKVHPKDEDGNRTCNKEMLDYLKKQENKNSINKNFPGWEDLKNNFNN